MGSLPNVTDSAGCVSLDCGDSGLSIAGNVIGILTFALAIVGSVAFYGRVIQDSEQEMTEASGKVRMRVGDLEALRSRLERNIDKYRGEEAAARLEGFLARATQILDQAHTMINGPQGGGKQLRRSVTGIVTLGQRAQFILQKDRIDTMLVKLDKAFDDLKEVAAEVFGEVPTEMDEVTWDMTQDLLELQKNVQDTLDRIVPAVEETQKQAESTANVVTDAMRKMDERLQALEDHISKL